MDSITIDKSTLKALVVESRLNILKLLSEKKYIQTEIADLLGMSKSTVKEHLDILEKSGLIKKEKTTRKWKYYSLTFKGKRIVSPRDVNVLFAFILTTIGFLTASYNIVKQYFPKGTFLSAKDATQDIILEATPKIANLATNQCAYVSEPTSGLIIVAVVLLTVSAFLLGYYFKNKTLIIKK